MVLDLPPATEAAMMLVAACPGGALSNVITAFGRGNLALSLSISAVSSVLALVLTPLNFTLMIAANPATAAWARSISVNPFDLVLSLVLLLAVPMSAAMLTSRYAPGAVARIRKPLARVGGRGARPLHRAGHRRAVEAVRGRARAHAADRDPAQRRRPAARLGRRARRVARRRRTGARW